MSITLLSRSIRSVCTLLFQAHLGVNEQASACSFEVSGFFFWLNEELVLNNSKNTTNEYFSLIQVSPIPVTGALNCNNADLLIFIFQATI